jgi:hypothetical protein
VEGVYGGLVGYAPTKMDNRRNRMYIHPRTESLRELLRAPEFVSTSRTYFTWLWYTSFDSKIYGHDTMRCRCGALLKINVCASNHAPATILLHALATMLLHAPATMLLHAPVTMLKELRALATILLYALATMLLHAPGPSNHAPGAPCSSNQLQLVPPVASSSLQ